jgi:hypothetical protein
MIVADGTPYFACKGLVWTDSNGWGEKTYEVKFTEADGIEKDIRGIKHLEISGVPPTVPSSIPLYLPNPQTDKDKDGNPYVEGQIYTWPDGSQAVVRNRAWEAVPVRNTACDPPQLPVAKSSDARRAGTAVQP